ncbi:pca operon transcription factor PcaQ [Allorhizobium sp. BGMRC 0089]|uniref:pca operon transcription factor PcaQ n=1 Tax=Allorhizobium sonneratiae TaxID=2934936 RepID=UPI002033BD45|nr:pca operon transcription factor PcaQ [Allorhizobium sonneratiae]MCM2293249.1 pca operon transcription factor PcaQ [Allorhizobium sonneratiae]
MIDQRIKFRHLQSFLEVARQKSVMKAAESLHVSQPAVTKTVRELEELLSVALFERDGRGIKLTRYGEIFLRHAGATISALQQAVDSVSQEAEKTGPPVRIGALPSVSTRIMPAAMQRFLAAETGSPIKVVTGDNAVLLDQLRLGELDMVVGRLAAPDKMTGLSFEHLYSEQVVFAVRAGHPLIGEKTALFERLRAYTVLMPTKTAIIRPFVESFLIANGVPVLPNQIETVSDSFGRAFLKSSNAVWIISEGVVSRDIGDGVLAALPIDCSATRGPVGLTIRAEALLPSAHLVMMKAIREAAALLQ